MLWSAFSPLASLGRRLWGVLGALRVRHFGEYPLIEDNRVRADASTLLNGETGYSFRSGIRVEATLLNLLNARASDIQYYYASRLRGEPAEGVEDIHFHPVEPRQVRLSVKYFFQIPPAMTSSKKLERLERVARAAPSVSITGNPFA